jgi:hypothetical protein
LSKASKPLAKVRRSKNPQLNPKLLEVHHDDVMLSNSDSAENLIKNSDFAYAAYPNVA